VEAHADGVASPLGAAARVAAEEGLELVRDVLPHAARVLATALRVAVGDVPVGVAALGVALSREDVLDVAARGAQLPPLDGAEVAEQLVRVEAVVVVASLSEFLDFGLHLGMGVGANGGKRR
jgi:hypothetical protein